jgi:XTP/dITP diphosphohydrolase
MELRFLTKNEYKLAEFKKLIEPAGHLVVGAHYSIDEIQTEDMDALVTDKCIKAFAHFKRPIFVDHTGLRFDFLDGFPGGLTEIFWNKLKNRRLCEIIGKSSNPKATAITLLGYCDGQRIHIFKGTIEGKVAPEPRGPEGFQWDPIFIPDGCSQTFAEMGEEKNQMSMRKLAVDQLLTHLDAV